MLSRPAGRPRFQPTSAIGAARTSSSVLASGSARSWGRTSRDRASGANAIRRAVTKAAGGPTEAAAWRAARFCDGLGMGAPVRPVFLASGDRVMLHLISRNEYTIVYPL